MNPGGEVVNGSAIVGERDDVWALGGGPNVRRAQARVRRADLDADGGAADDDGESGVERVGEHGHDFTRSAKVGAAGAGRITG